MSCRPKRYVSFLLGALFTLLSVHSPKGNAAEEARVHFIFHKVINDSCAQSISVSGCEIQRCDNGLLVTPNNDSCKQTLAQLKAPQFEEYKGERPQISSVHYDNLIREHILSSNGDNKLPQQPDGKNLRVPNDSCSVGFRSGNCHFLRCDSGHYKSCGENAFTGVSDNEWNKNAQNLFLTQQRQRLKTSHAE